MKDVTYPSFRTEITIQPGDAKYCGVCRHCIEDPDDDAEWCDVFAVYLTCVQPGDVGTTIRCPACLAAEKAARERPRMLQECPRCHGAAAHGNGYGDKCSCEYGNKPGWIEVTR
jgi:hypothetical protein